MPTSSVIVAWAGSPALMASPSAWVTWTVAIAALPVRPIRPVAGATKMTPVAPAARALLERATEPHSFVTPSARSVQSTIAILPETPLTTPQAPVGWAGGAVTTIAMSVGPISRGSGGSRAEMRAG